VTKVLRARLATKELLVLLEILGHQEQALQGRLAIKVPQDQQVIKDLLETQVRQEQVLQGLLAIKVLLVRLVTRVIRDLQVRLEILVIRAPQGIKVIPDRQVLLETQVLRAQAPQDQPVTKVLQGQQATRVTLVRLAQA